MKTMLLVSATSFEVAPLLQKLSPKLINNHVYQFTDEHQVKICITGVGMTLTALNLGKLFNQTFDVVLNVGVAGSFTDYPLGTLVQVNRDCFSELGAEDGEQFLSIDSMKLGESTVNLLKPYTSNWLNTLPACSGITVNTVHGHPPSIEKIISRLHPDIETMEGAAFMLAANQFNWCAAQVRAISNQVEKRDKNKWQLEKAIHQLNDFTFKLIEEWSNPSN